MHRTPTAGIRSVATTIGFTTLFMLATSWLLLSANGYVVNLRSLSIQQRALISLAGLPTRVDVIIDGRSVSQKLPTTIRNVIAGQHEIRITAPGLQDWQLTTSVSAGQAVVRDSIELFRISPIPLNGTLPTVSDAPFVDPNLSVVDGEISRLVGAQRTLITRFSQPILAAQLSNDRAHVFVQLGNQILVTELDGANTTPLVTLLDTKPVIISPSARDSVLAVRAGETVQAWQIR